MVPSPEVSRTSAAYSRCAFSSPDATEDFYE